ncbi:MAG: hypothetical protein ACOH13_00055 [Flavobacteriales bacterium]
MALSSVFKPGTLQALEAHLYFRDVANARVRSELAVLTPKQYLVQQPGHEDLYLRVRSDRKIVGAEPWVKLIRHLLAAVKEVEETSIDPYELFHVLRSFTADGPGSVEVLGHGPFTDHEQVALTLGMENGHAVLLSSPRLMCVELHDGLYGLAVHERGSWLLEEINLAPRISVPRAGTA